jgi:hypothetical protein
VDEVYRWPVAGPTNLPDALAPREVVEALFAPESLRVDNRTPPEEPTFVAICAPTEDQRLNVVVCVRSEDDGAWTVVGARDANMNERQM